MNTGWYYYLNSDGAWGVCYWDGMEADAPAFEVPESFRWGSRIPEPELP